MSWRTTSMRRAYHRTRRRPKSEPGRRRRHPDDLSEQLRVPDALQVLAVIPLTDEARPVGVARRLGELRDPVAASRIELMQRRIVEWDVGAEELAEHRARVRAGVEGERRPDVGESEPAERQPEGVAGDDRGAGGGELDRRPDGRRRAVGHPPDERVAGRIADLVEGHLAERRAVAAPRARRKTRA